MKAIKARIKDLSFTRDGQSALTLVTCEDLRNFYDKAHEYELDVTIKRWRRRRSLDANAYFWALAGKLAEKTGVPVTDIYREAVRDIGGNTEIVCVRQNAVAKLCEAWKKNGMGWLADTTPSKIKGCTNVILYYGSSTYDTAQMSRLINLIVDECKEAGIETVPPQRLQAMMDEWGR